MEPTDILPTDLSTTTNGHVAASQTKDILLPPVLLPTTQFLPDLSGAARPEVISQTTRYLLRPRFLAIHISHLHICMDTPILEGLAHTHEEHLMFILGPLQDVVPLKKGVSWYCLLYFSDVV